MKSSVAAALLASAVCAHAAVPADCWNLRKHGRAAEAQTCFEGLTQRRDPYFRGEGFWGLEQWQQANTEFHVASDSPSSPALVKVRWGLLFHERFNNQEAANLFHEALEKDPANAQAYLGLAMVSAGRFERKVWENGR